MTENSVAPVEDDVDVWLDKPGIDPDGSLREIDVVVVANLPQANRRLWRGVFWGGTAQTIIGYGDIVQPRPRGADVRWFLVGVARQKRHVSIYVNAAEGNAYLSHMYGDRLTSAGGSVKVGAAALTCGSVADLDLVVLADLVSHAGRVQPYS